MRSVSARQVAAVDENHDPVYRILVTPPGGDEVELPYLAGTFLRDGDTWPATQLRVKVPTDGLPYTGVAGIPPYLLPHGTTARLLWGIGTPNVLLAAQLHLITARLDRPEGMWDLFFGDQSVVISLDRVTADEYPPAPAPTNVGEAVAWLVHRTLPGLAVGPDPSPIPNGWTPTGDPWKQAIDLVQTAGKSLRMTSDGSRVDIVPTATVGAPVDVITTDRNITGYKITWERVYNAVAVEYRTPEGGVVVGRWDETRPDAPLYGLPRSTYYETRDGSPSQAQANQAALELARLVAGRMQSTQLRVVPRPWLEPGDTVTVSYLGQVSSNVLVEAIDVPLDSDAMTVTLRNPQYPDLDPI